MVTENNPDFDKLSRTLENMTKNLGEMNVPDVILVSRRLESMTENMGKMDLPDVALISRRLENMTKKMSKISVPDLTHLSRKLEDMTENIGKINIPDVAQLSKNLENMTQKMGKMSELNLPNLDKIISIRKALIDYPDIIYDIDWESFELTPESIEQANVIFESENSAEIVSQEISKEKDGKSIKESVKLILSYTCTIISFLMWFFGVSPIDIVNVTVSIIAEKYQHYVEHDEFNSVKESLKWLNNEIKEDVSKEDLKNLRIITKNNLIAREENRVASGISAKLNSGDVVQIIDKKKNWTYVLLSNYEDDEIKEGWVFTRYLKKIK